jgi:hypothetical protein
VGKFRDDIHDFKSEANMSSEFSSLPTFFVFLFGTSSRTGITMRGRLPFVLLEALHTTNTHRSFAAYRSLATAHWSNTGTNGATHHCWIVTSTDKTCSSGNRDVWRGWVLLLVDRVTERRTALAAVVAASRRRTSFPA